MVAKGNRTKVSIKFNAQTIRDNKNHCFADNLKNALAKLIKRNYGRFESIATQIRRDIVRMVHGAQAAPGGSLGAQTILQPLFQVAAQSQFSMDGKTKIFLLIQRHIPRCLFRTSEIRLF